VEIRLKSRQAIEQCWWQNRSTQQFTLKNGDSCATNRKRPCSGTLLRVNPKQHWETWIARKKRIAHWAPRSIAAAMAHAQNVPDFRDA
jgi:hypothetical protein